MDQCRIDLRSVDWKIDTMGVQEWLLESSNTSDDTTEALPASRRNGITDTDLCLRKERKARVQFLI
jgi:hypothetical protein